MSLIHVRQGQVIDCHQINDIFNWYVENSFVTFSEKTSSEERKKWFDQFSQGSSQQLFVAQKDGEVVGFACSYKYRGGGVFAHTVETSVYVRHDCGGQGIGGRLYSTLLTALAEAEFHRVLVGIALPNEASIALHKKMGFEPVGIFDEYAKYKGQYYSSLWMQKKLQIVLN